MQRHVLRRCLYFDESDHLLECEGGDEDYDAKCKKDGTMHDDGYHLHPEQHFDDNQPGEEKGQMEGQEEGQGGKGKASTQSGTQKRPA